MVTMMHSKNTTTATPVLGAFEVVSLPEFGIFDMIAKTDTGAYSGALHCETIEEIHGDGKKKLRFTPTEDHKSHVTEHYSRTRVRSSNGQEARRYLIETKIVIQGQTYPIKIGLSNRSEMKYDMLLGRRFIRENGMLVDVRMNQEYDTDGIKEV